KAELKAIAEGVAGEAELHTLTLYKLMKAFEKVMARYEYEKNKPQHRVVRYAYTMEEQKEMVLSQIRNEQNVSFERLFHQVENRIHAIFVFLGLLELIQSKLVQIQ